MKTLRFIFPALLLGMVFPLTAQDKEEKKEKNQWMTRDGYVSFFSSTPVEDIKAENNQMSSVIDLSTGEVAFQVPMKGFQFEKSLMQEHFNENFIESHEYPKGTFKGKITDLDEVEDLSEGGPHTLHVQGTMNIHGVDKDIETEIQVEVKGDHLMLNSEFQLAPADFEIEIPSSVRENIAKEVDVTVKAKYSKRS